MILKLKRTPGIYLVGFMGSGKTTVGRSLAWELGWSFADIDEEIETLERCPISEIFEKQGEAAFRKIEADVIAKHVQAIERGRPSVVALGGGAFIQEPVFQMLENNGISIWLDCPLDLVRVRVGQTSNRPLARDPQQMERLYETRRPAYARSDFRIEVTGDDAAEVVATILNLPIF